MNWALEGLVLLCGLQVLVDGVFGATFTLVNSCPYTVWPGVLSNAGQTLLSGGGFELQPGQSATLTAPAGWSGRFWGRTGCLFTGMTGRCATGDCGGQLECGSAGATTPATLAEFTLGGGMATPVKQDFYDVSLVDGYNLPIAIIPRPSSPYGSCTVAGCSSDLNMECPPDLQVVLEGQGVVGCKSACDAFQSPQYCCAGPYANPSTCKPSTYSQLFKVACPRAYSYAYDDPTSTFTCVAAEYRVVFCPSSSSEKTVTGLGPGTGSSLLGSQAYAGSSSDGRVLRGSSCLNCSIIVLLLWISMGRIYFV